MATKTKKSSGKKGSASHGRIKGLKEPVEATTPAEVETPVASVAAPTAEAKRKAQKEPKAAKTPKAPKEKGERKLGALDAAAKVLLEKGEPMNTKDVIAAMAAKGYWSSPNGQTPAATLYSAILREIKTKGTDSRFEKTDRGTFGLKKA